MPGTGFKVKAKAWNKVTTACAEEPFQFVKDRMVGPFILVPRLLVLIINTETQ